MTMNVLLLTISSVLLLLSCDYTDAFITSPRRGAVAFQPRAVLVPSVLHAATTDTNDETSPPPPFLLLNHVNLNVPDYKYTKDFYCGLLGCGLDPKYEKDDGKQLRVTCGPSQFHFPFIPQDASIRVSPQVLPGHVGLLYKSLDGLKERLKEQLMTIDDPDDRCFSSYEYGTSPESGREFIKLVDRFGNVFYAREQQQQQQDEENDHPHTHLFKPIVSKHDSEKYGLDESDCIGIDYVEVNIPPRTARKVASFYYRVFGAPSNVVKYNDTQIAMVSIGGHDEETGKSVQSLLFREMSADEQAKDEDFNKDHYQSRGHVSLYVDDDHFEEIYKKCERMGLIWVNPTIEGELTISLNSAKKYKSFRFKNLLDTKYGKTLYQMEHQIRSTKHLEWAGPKKRISLKNVNSATKAAAKSIGYYQASSET